MFVVVVCKIGGCLICIFFDLNVFLNVMVIMNILGVLRVVEFIVGNVKDILF